MVPHLKLFSICSVTGLPWSSANICYAPSLAQAHLHDAMHLSCLIGASLNEPHTDKFRFCHVSIYILGRCLQHRGGEPEQVKGADGMQLFALDCIACIVDTETD